MKYSVWIALAGFSTCVLAQNEVESKTPEPQVAERGPHHRVLERQTVRVLPNGRSITNRTGYTELATGLHYWKDGQWLDSKEEIEILQGAAVARQGQHQVTFAANLNSPGAIDMLDPSGKRFRSHVLGLAYTDYSSGQSVLIAEVKDSIGAVLPPNQVIYQDAFEGDCLADVRYTYTLGGFEQDVILLTAPPSPAFYGFNPETTRLEMWTEFIDLPEGTMTPVILKQESDPIARQNMVEPDLIDYRLDFGVMKFEQGQAFPLGDSDPFSGAVVPTGKSVESINGRVFLIEKVDHADIRAHLQQLPQAAANFQRNIFNAIHDRTLFAQGLPAPKGERGVWKAKQFAKVESNRKGFVMDYITLNSSLTNYVIKADTTYCITNTVNLYGTTVIEGGTVIKGAGLAIRGPLDCRTSPYRPATWTIKNDDSIGEIISGSTGSPSGYNGTMLNLYDTSAICDLHDFRMSYAIYGVILNGGTKADLSHFQIGKSQNAVGLIAGTTAKCRNFLIYDVSSRAFPLNGAVTNRSEHGTLHRVGYYRQTTNASSIFTLTNSLLIAVTNNILFDGINNVVSSSDSGFFQTVGAGSYYLVDASTNRNAGTANINPDLATALKKKTTYPPVVLTNKITANTNFSIMATRGTSSPDLGYAYDPLDYVAYGISVSNAAVTISSGTAVGVYGGSGTHGLRLEDGSSLTVSGDALSLCRFTRYNLVQEQATTNWSASSAGRLVVDASWGGSPRPIAEFKFTEWSMPAGGPELFSGDYAYGPDTAQFDFIHSQLRGGLVTTFSVNLTFTNCLFDRVGVLDLSADSDYFNCLFFGGYFNVDGAYGTHNVADSFFDRTYFDTNTWIGIINHHNGYITNEVRLYPEGTNSVIVSDMVYQSTPVLGRFYQPTSSLLLNTGSVSAASAGLYHFTTTTNQVKETNSTVDLGFHYVALNGQGQPVDSDGDGLPDSVEDSNGDGVTDGSENSHVNPVLTIVSAMDYIKGGPGKRFDTNAVAYDADSVNLSGAKLMLTITSGAEIGDRLGIRSRGTNAGQISAGGTLVSYGGTVIATNAGGTGTEPLVISFNANAVNASLQDVVRNLTFQNISNNPANSNRVVTFELTDGRGGTNSPATQTITIVCPDAMDLMLVLDRSNSMIREYDPNCPNETNYTTDISRFWIAKDAVSNFVASLNLAGNDRVGLISFADLATLNAPLTNSAAAVQSEVHALINTSGTMLNHPINLAKTNLMNSASNTLRVMVILSDGEIFNGSEQTNPSVEVEMEAARQAADENIRIITVAFYTGECPRAGGTNYLADISGSPLDYYFIDPGSLDYHYAPTFQDMASNFVAVAQSLCRNVFPPSVTITAPSNNTTNLLPTNLVVTATASDTDGTITKVEFYNFGTTKIGEDLSSPYSIVWTNPPFGTNNPLTARATDNSGLITTSSVVNVIVHSPPSISIVVPTNSTAFAVTNLLVRAAAADLDGYVTNVLFYTNGTAGLNVTNPPFQFPWTNLPGAVSYNVYAIAKDNHGYTNRSSTVSFDVTTCPQVGVSNLTLSASTVLGGSTVTATITLSNSAPAGGQIVSLLCASPNISIPASILVPAGTNKATFIVSTYTTTNGDPASVTASTPLKTNSANLTIQAAAFTSARFYQQCGPLDVAFAVDTTLSMTASLAKIQNSITNIVDSIAFASGGDYRVALVSFGTANCGGTNTPIEGERVIVHQTFTTNRTDFTNKFFALKIDHGSGAPETSDEALNTIIHGLSVDASRTNSYGTVVQCGDFSIPFRLHARKIIVLITDNPPSGTNDMFEAGVDDIRAHRLAVDAALEGIQICTALTTLSDPGDVWDATAVSIVEDYAFVTGGLFLKANPSPSQVNVDLVIQQIVGQCGADMGEIINTRDDLWQWNHAAVSLNDSLRQSASLNPATFDLSGVEAPVVSAQFRRTGRLRINYGSRFDLDLGLASITDTNLAFFALPTLSASTNAIGVAYATNWNLPFPFYTDIQQRLGSIYSVDLVDRASTICGNNFDVVDTAQSDWPAARNRLTFKTLSRFEIAQGRCRDFMLVGTNAPCGTNCVGLWEIRLYDEVIASACMPHGWSVESDHGVYGGVNICAPTDALTANRYEVRFLEGGTNPRSGYFAVVPAGLLPTAPVLKPVELSLPTCSSNTAVTVTVSLDAPALEQEAFVSLTVSGITLSNVPVYVRIPMGQTSASFTFRPPTVATDTPFEIDANYNGERRVSGKVIPEVASLPSFELTVESDSKQVLVKWDDVSGSLYYRVWRTVGSVSNLLAGLVFGTCFVDEHPVNNSNHCYFVEAINSYDSEPYPGFNNCLLFSSDVVLRPRIIPHGGRFNDFVLVDITCETTNATIRYTTDGTVPSATIGADYTGPILFYDSAQVIAKAHVGGSWSLDDRADFHVSQPNSIQCGDTFTATLAVTNQPSMKFGSGYYGARYGFNARRGDSIHVSTSQENFNVRLILWDSDHNEIADAPSLVGTHPGIVHTARTPGAYYLEVTSNFGGETGDVVVHVDCQQGAELDVFFGTTNVTNNAAFDLGLKTNGATAQLTLLITNSGSATLTFSSITLTPTNLFTNSPLTITSLATNSATNFTVYYRALSNGPWTGTLTLANNDDFDDAPNGYEFDDPFVIQFAAFVNPPGVPPTVTITNLSNGQVLTTPPTLTIGATTTVTNTASVTQVVFRATGPSGTISLGAVTASPWRVDWNNAVGGNYTLQAIVLDSAGRMGLSAPTNIIVNNWPVAVDDSFDVSMNVTNDLNVLANDSDPNGHVIMITNIVSQGTRGTASVVDGVLYYVPTNNAFGRDTVKYGISDIYNARATGTVSILIRPSGQFFTFNYTNSTQVALPSNHVEIIGPTNVIGTAHSDFLDRWELEYRRRGGARSVWTQIATGTTNVWNGLLGVFDPTGLPNGQYDLRVTLHDFFGSSQDSDATVVVTENNKIGHFTLSFTDLQIPVSGLPITLTRTYDSRHTDSGDFGAGWNLDVSSVRLEKSGLMGEGWGGVQGTGSFGQGFAGLQETEGHEISVVFPDGKVFRFVPVIGLNGTDQNQTGATGLDQAWANVTYTNLPGTVGTLRELNPTAYLDIKFAGFGPPVTLHDSKGIPSEAEEDEDDGPIYDPQEFEFTTLDQRKFQFNAAGRVVKMTDRVGNSLEFRDDGIIHSSGKSVKFIRDAAGRITEIYDPNGLNSSNQPSGPPVLQYKYDAAGNLENALRLNTRNATNPAYLTTSMGYTNAKYPHYLTDITDPRGIKAVRNEYGDDGRLKSMTDASGKTITFTHNVNGKTETIVDRLSNTTVFKYDAKGNVTNSLNALGQINSYDFDANNNKTREIIAGVLTNTFVFDANNLLTESVVGGMITNKFTYNQFGQVLAALDGLNRGTTNFYDALGNLLRTTNALGFTNGFVYTASGNLASMRDALGILTTNWFDEYGNITNAVTGNLAASAYTYDVNGNRLIETQWRQVGYENVEALVTNTLVYDAQNRVIASIDSLGNTNHILFNELGRHEEVTDALGRVTRYNYDLRGSLTNVTYPDATTEQYAYDAEGRRTNSVDRAGRSTGFIFDALGRLTQTTYPDNTTTRTIYDPVGRVQFTVDALGVTNAFGYDAAGRRIAVTNAWGTDVAQWSTNAYDAGGNITASGDALGRVTRYTYDALNQRVQTIFPDNTTHTTIYNGAGQRIGDVDAAGVTNRFGYHLHHRTLQAVTNAWATPSATWATYAFDLMGRQTNQVDALGRRTAYEFDADGRRQRRLLPGGQWEGFRRDANGNAVAHTNFISGLIMTNQFDSQNRLLGVWHGSTQLVSYAYGLTGVRTQMVDSSGTYVWIYDNRDRVRTNITPAGVVYYDYDANGNLTNLTSSTTSGVSIGYQYDALNRITNVIDNRLGLAAKNTVYQFDGVGNLSAIGYPNGATNLWQYDSLNRLTNEVWKAGATPLASFFYQLDATGQRTNLSETVNGGSRTYSWRYDSAQRLTNELLLGTSPTGYVAYAYDVVGNRTNRASTLAGITNQALSYNTNDGLTIDAYDLAGNTRTNSGNVFLYDWANRLTNAVLGTTNVSIVYNGDGQRVKKTVTVGATTTVTLYLMDEFNPTGYAQVLEEKSVVGSTTNLVKAFVYGLDLISQRIPNVTTNFYGADGIGSTRFLLNLAGGVSDTYVFDAFGTILAKTGGTTNENLFHGEFRDSHLGLDIRPARYYTANFGRWWTMDSWEGSKSDPVSLHKYAGFGNSPANRVDPSGHDYTLPSTVTVNAGIQTTTRTTASAGAARGLAIGVTVAEWNATAAAYQAGVSGSLLYKGFAAGIAGATIAAHLAAVTALLDPVESVVAAQQTILKEDVEKEARKKGCSGPLLFYYRDAITIAQAYTSSSLPISGGYTKPGELVAKFPAGGYASDIAPWDPRFSQKELAWGFFGPGSLSDARGVSFFVAFCADSGWKPLPNYITPGIFHYHKAPEPGALRIPIRPVAAGVNAMKSE